MAAVRFDPCIFRLWVTYRHDDQVLSRFIRINQKKTFPGSQIPVFPGSLMFSVFRGFTTSPGAINYTPYEVTPPITRGDSCNPPPGSWLAETCRDARCSPPAQLQARTAAAAHRSSGRRFRSSADVGSSPRRPQGPVAWSFQVAVQAIQQMLGFGLEQLNGMMSLVYIQRWGYMYCGQKFVLPLYRYTVVCYNTSKLWDGHQFIKQAQAWWIGNQRVSYPTVEVSQFLDILKAIV